jgi:hypothetical protein
MESKGTSTININGIFYMSDYHWPHLLNYNPETEQFTKMDVPHVPGHDTQRFLHATSRGTILLIINHEEGTEYSTSGDVIERGYDGWRHGAEVIAEPILHDGCLYFLNYYEDNRTFCKYILDEKRCDKIRDKFN